jgi:AcrR family transcriptional regulator
MIEEVAAKAEVSKATLYNYFPNKDSLLVGTMDDVTESFEKFIRGFDSHMKADEKIYMAMKFLILDSIPFVGISRRILFLNGCRDSEMFGKANTIKNIFDIMVKQAQKEGIFKSELTDKDIVDELMGVYLISQFQWTDLETMTEEECVQRIERLLDLTLAGCYVNK